MSDIPLFSGRQLDDPLAWTAGGKRSIRDLLADAQALRRCLPPGNAIVNLCHDRYRFAVGFVAGLLDGRVSLQPASQTADTLARLAAEFPRLVCLCDGHFDTGALPRLDFPDLSAAEPAAIDTIPAFPAGQLAAILFTSGSTGQPQAHHKTWGKLACNGQAGAARLVGDGPALAIVGTVPVQHSYGFESTFLLALQGGCSFFAGKPFYPQDIADALAAVPRPRLLVTTPFHLSTLLAAGLPLPPIDVILSATAPLSEELAARAEATCNAPVMEIYGSTETGQLASRRTTQTRHWHLLDGTRLEIEGDQAWACDGHVEGRVPLADLVEQLPDGDFLLVGRHADLINIAGKRTSLAWLNHQIAAIPGVVDAAFLLPEETASDGILRLAAFVVAPGLTRAQLLAGLRQRIDPIFLPRPLVLLDALPRNSTGKLPRQALLALYERRSGHG